MATIRNEADLGAWLRGRPDTVARVIAVRAPLAALPYMATYVARSPEANAAAIVLPSFRATSPPWFAGTRPNQGGEEFSAAGAAAWAAAWERVETDTDVIDAGASARQLASRPIWLSLCPKTFTSSWEFLKSELLALHGNWRVWTDWYEDRLAGIEASRPFIPEQSWNVSSFPMRSGNKALTRSTRSSQSLRTNTATHRPRSWKPPSPTRSPPSLRLLSARTAACTERHHRESAPIMRGARTCCARLGRRTGICWTA